MQAKAILTFTLLTLLLLPRGGWAQSGSERYKVRKGDTLELLAAEYYGNRVHKIYIMVQNGLDHDRPLTPGEVLRIPISQQIAIAEGDTLAGLAETYLGSAKRVDYLAEINAISPSSSLALGQIITIPMRVHYKAKGNEKLRDIALGLFADAKLATLLRQYNELESPELTVGQVISIPVPKIKVQASKRRPRDADAKARIAQRAEALRQAQQALPIAQSAWLSGNYALAKRELVQLDLDYLDAELAAKAGVLLGSVYVAFDDTDSAIASFSYAIKRSEDLQLDEKRYSPKIRAIWKQAVAAHQ